MLKNHTLRNYKLLSRYYSKKSVLSSEQIRQSFLDYFNKDNGHTFIRSSPVVPFCDPTVPFVNAGMNQFKPIFLAERSPPHLRVANSQKCIRVGGKHNDLEIVGLDGYHHTFFEMLGNWSFGDYFKEEACTLAWNLLTGPYKLNPSRLYVTYFGGDTKHNLLPDDETKDIWRRLGVPSDHIIPFGMADNFWEMGFTGPCGPCTEIHIDHRNTNYNRTSDVNKGLPDLTELWNIVFIQYNRNSDGSITLLPKYHVDTGMGLERLTAILQNKLNNYDTDLFQPIFDGIQKYVKNCPSYSSKFGKDDISGLDTSYRIVADHSRMITASLADGIIPEENYKLRRIIRKVISIGDKYFNKNEDFVWNICKLVIEKMGPIYPEMVLKETQIKSILSYEEEVFKSLCREKDSNWIKLVEKHPHLNKIDLDAVPGFILGYKELLSLIADKKISNFIPNTLAIKLYDSYGLEKDKISEIATIFNLNFNVNGFEQELQNLRVKSKQNYIKGEDEEKMEKAIENLIEKGIPKTDDAAKYSYEFEKNEYKFEKIEAKLLGIIKHGIFHSELNVEKKDEVFLIFDKTNLYTESGGQENDVGKIVFLQHGTFLVKNTINLKGYILHNASLIDASSCKITVNENIFIEIDEERRLNNMRNHTATHLINASVKSIFHDLITCQKSSRVSATDLKFDFNVFGGRLNIENIQKIEELINKIIQLNKPVLTQIVDSSKIYSDPNIVLVPGETYPDNNIRLVKIPVKELDFLSKEACCGTHVLNTKDLKHFVITNFKMNGRASYTIKAATAFQSKEIRKRGEEIEKVVDQICDPALKKTAILSELLVDVKNLIKDLNSDNLTTSLPFVVRSQCLEKLNSFVKSIKTMDRENLRLSIDEEIEELVENTKSNRKSWLVHNMQTVSSNDSISLSKITRAFIDTPVIIISYANSQVKARCCVPKDHVTEYFNADLWLKETVAKVFNCQVAAPKGQDPLTTSNMKSRKVEEKKWEQLLEEALQSANTYAQNNINTKENIQEKADV